MDSPTSKQSMASANQSFSKNFDINALIPKNHEQRLLGSEFAVISQVEEDSLKTVFPAYKNLSDAVNGLDTKIGNIVRRQNEDSLQDYRNEMLSIQKELVEMRRKYEEFMSKNNGDEIVLELRRQIDQHKVEASKLDKVLLKKEKDIQVLKIKVNFLEEERKFLNEYIATTVRKNKLISIERHTKPPVLAANLPTRMDRRATAEARFLPAEQPKSPNASFLEDKNGIFKLSNVTPDEYGQDLSNVTFDSGIAQLDEFLNTLKTRDFTDRFRILKDVESFCKGLSLSCKKNMQETKKKILREKTKIDGFLNSRLIARSELADIFEDCIKRVKLMIEKRKLEKGRMTRDGSDLGTQKSGASKIEFKDFLSQDKERLIEFFVFDDTILNVIKYLISGGRGLPQGQQNPRQSPVSNADKSMITHNQSMDNANNQDSTMLGDISDLNIDPIGKERRKRSVQPIRNGLLHPIGLNSTYISESQAGTGERKDERRSVMNKMEQLLGPGHPGLNNLRMRDVIRNYKI